jgi:replication-associated recombination protein RarA
MAVCWNVAEGWPTEALEKGVLRSVEDGLVELLELLEARSEEVPEDVHALGERLSRLFEERDTHYDLTDGRPYDCAGCLAKSARSSE